MLFIFYKLLIIYIRADVTWLNGDWSEWTHYTYSTIEINKLEKRFLYDMNFNLYISNINYSQFVSYLEFRLYTRQLMFGIGNISYRDMDVLSQSLKPEYVARLQLKLRPFEAMILIAKQATSILFMYAATIVTCISIIQQSNWILLQLQNKEQLAMVILSGIDYYNNSASTSSNLGESYRHSIATTASGRPPITVY
jgi:hypothetical protein